MVIYELESQIVVTKETAMVVQRTKCHCDKNVHEDMCDHSLHCNSVPKYLL